MRHNRSRGFRGQLTQDINKLQRQKEKIERRVQKMVQELVLIDNLIKAMEVARNPEAPTPATEAIQVAEGTQKANAEMDALLPKPEVETKKEESNVQAQS